jgi:hypothetical protein
MPPLFFCQINCSLNSASNVKAGTPLVGVGRRCLNLKDNRLK